MHAAIEALSDTRREILLRIKQKGGVTIAEIARHLSISDEGARQHLIILERQGWLSRRPRHPSDGRSGRPASIYEISAQGETFFPKRYDDLSIALIDVVGELHGPDAVETALERVTHDWVNVWEPRVRGKSLDDRIEILREYYIRKDPFVTIERNGHVAIVERNCPFRNVAMARPYICSVTVNALTRLLGVRVVREKTFQGGDGCCEFRVLPDEPVDPSRVRFTMEDPGGNGSKD